MSDNVWVNADRSAIVGRFGPGKKFQLSRKEAARIGLLTDDTPQPQPRRVILAIPKPRQKRRKSKR